MNTRRFSSVLAIVLALAGLFVTSARAQAQGASITGIVTTQAGAPIEGATVSVAGSNAGAITNNNGAFTIRLPAARAGESLNLIARRIGYQPVTRPVTVAGGAQSVNFALVPQASVLDAVVVTGLAGATTMRNTTISISNLAAEQIQQVPPTNPAAAIAGKVPGARVSFTTGAPGSAPAIQLRGSTNLTIGNNQPLVLIDGVVTRQGLEDIDGNDIESIEILKGAASADAFGSQGANGVIAVTTKRGRALGDNKTEYTTRNEFGTSSLAHFMDFPTHHQYLLAADGSIALDASGQPIEKPDHILDNPYPASTPPVNQLQAWSQHGQFRNNYFNIAARRGGTNISTSLAYNKDQGILPFRQGYNRSNARLNIDQILSDKLDVSTSILYGVANSDIEASQRGNTTLGTFFQLLQAPPNVNLARPNPDSVPYYYSLKPYAKNDYGNPLYLLRNEADQDRKERIIGSASARFRPLSWLTFDGTYGTERMNQGTNTYQFRGGYFGSQTPQQGYLENYTEGDVGTNQQASATAVWSLLNSLNSTTRLTYAYDDQSHAWDDPFCRKLNYAGVTSLANCDPAQISLNSFSATIRSQDYFVNQSLNFRDTYLAQILLRRDESSLFGAQRRSKDFYGLSAAWRVTQSFNLPGIEEFKIRAARGTAGLRPNFVDQYETYSIGSGVASKSVKGNPFLEPAVQLENEFGINTSFLNHFDFEITKSDRRTRGAFLSVPLSSAQTGGYTSQVQNAATVSARSLELGLNLRAIERSDFAYSIGVTGSRTRQWIDELNRPPFPTGNGTNGTGQNVFWYIPGKPLGIIYGDIWMTNLNQLLDNPANTTANGFKLSDYTINEEGYVVRVADKGTLREAPLKYINPATAFNGLYLIANVNPNYIFGVAQNLRWHGFQVYGLLDGAKGGQVYDYNKLYMYINNNHADFDQAAKPQSARKPYDYYSVFYNAQIPSTRFVEDGSFVKLRELSVSYTLGNELFQGTRLGRIAKGMKIALVGRNLKTWSKYTGLDPEAASDNDPNFRVDGFRYPPLRQVTGQIQLTF